MFTDKKTELPEGNSVFLVAEMGFEPHDLRVMSPTSYQLLYSAIWTLSERVMLLYNAILGLSRENYGFATSF